MLTQEHLQDAVDYGRCFIKLGSPASYIPELARVNKYQLGACIVNLDGTVMECGDTRTRFTIQSISKLASLILAISDKGSDYLFHDKVGVEPTGAPVQLYRQTGNQNQALQSLHQCGSHHRCRLHRRQQLRGKIRALFILCTQAVRR